MLGGVGSTSAAIRGMITIAPMPAICAAMETGTVYHFREPTLIVGFAISPNISRGTAVLLSLPKPAHHEKRRL
jgi:hypothetical protein